MKKPRKKKEPNRCLAGLWGVWLALAGAFASVQAGGETLVILQTNDTHSQMEPTAQGLGGLARRVALLDSVRSANPAGHVLTVDTGDAVQGTLYFNVYGGEVENRALRLAGYDMAVLGNHDFDNGADSLARVMEKAERLYGAGPQWLTANYRFAPDSPLNHFFQPYTVREIGGVKVGFLGLNLVPKGMIAEGNYDGVEYSDAVEAANAVAWLLRHMEGCEVVVALTHIGYNSLAAPTDRQVAEGTKGIDVILGGHSHTLIRPGSGDEWVTNAAGHPVLVVQSGSRGEYLSEVAIDLDSIGAKLPRFKQYAVDSRYDGRPTEAAVEEFLQPYREGIAAEMNVPVAEAAIELDNKQPALLNFIADFIAERGDRLSRQSDGKGVDFAIMNKGSLRKSLALGTVTRGDIFTLQPFNNRIQVLELSGQDVLDALQVMAARGGDGVSGSVDVTFDDPGGVVTALLNGREIDPSATYRVATIDYLAHGGDYMEPLTRGRLVAESPQVIRLDLIDYLGEHHGDFANQKINPSRQARMRKIGD